MFWLWDDRWDWSFGVGKIGDRDGEIDGEEDLSELDEGHIDIIVDDFRLRKDGGAGMEDDEDDGWG